VVLDSSTAPLEVALIFFGTDEASAESTLALILALGSACVGDGLGEPGVATCGAGLWAVNCDADFGAVTCAEDFGGGICVAVFGMDRCE
jgi:hypothetical protein